jgi:hypothetical protein
MRSRSWARWATCALAISVSVPVVAFADHAKSLSDCTAFDQADKGEDKVEFTIHNTCTIPVDCTVSWRVVCAPDSKKRRNAHANATKLAISDNTSQSADASAAICGDDAWAIDSVNWSCQPNKD